MAVALFGGDDNNKKEVKKENTQKEEAPKWLIAEHEYGENYPYTEYYLQIFCYNNAVWFETMEGNIYAINGIAKSSDLSKGSKYQGGTEKFLKQGMTDLFTPDEACKICYKLSYGEYKLRTK